MELKNRKKSEGFTLVEVILAAMILCMSVLAIGAVNTRSIIQTKLNRQYETAASLANRQLSLIDYIGVDNFLKAGRTEGKIEYVGISFDWQVATELQATGLYMVTVKIGWLEGRKTYSVAVKTMMKATEELAEIETGTSS